jgi:hypothetical protein
MTGKTTNQVIPAGPGGSRSTNFRHSNSAVGPAQNKNFSQAQIASQDNRTD